LTKLLISISNNVAQMPSGWVAGLEINMSRVEIMATVQSNATLGKLFKQTHMPLSPSSILVPANGRWCLAARKAWHCTPHASNIYGSPSEGSRPGREMSTCLCSPMEHSEF